MTPVPESLRLILLAAAVLFAFAGPGALLLLALKLWPGLGKWGGK